MIITSGREKERKKNLSLKPTHMYFFFFSSSFTISNRREEQKINKSRLTESILQFISNKTLFSNNSIFYEKEWVSNDFIHRQALLYFEHYYSVLI